MIAVLAAIVAALLFLNAYSPPLLLRSTEFDTLDSLCTYAMVVGQPAPTGTDSKTTRFESRLIGRWDSTRWTPLNGKIYLFVAPDSARSLPLTGDTLITRTRIRRPAPAGSFDYGLYLRRQGFIGTAFTSLSHSLVCPKDGLYSVSKAVCISAPQSLLFSRLAAGGLKGDELATVGALTLGYKEDLSPELKHRFQASGAAHVLAVSGLHTGIIYALVIGLLTLGGRVRPHHEDRPGRCLVGAVVIAVMWAYAALTGMTPSVVRCVVMVTLVEIGKMLYRYSPTLNTIAAAAVLILIFRPLDLWSVSFQLSFAATAAIVIVVSETEHFLHRLRWRQTFFGRIAAWLVGTVVISLAAQTGTLPITIACFGQVSPYFLLANLIVLPLASVLVPCGLVSIALGGTVAGVWFSKITFALAWLMNHSVGWIESLPGSVLPAHTNGPLIVIYYLLLTALALVFHPSRTRFS